MKTPSMLSSGASWLYALKTSAAAILALYIALATQLDRPGWAVTTVFIASQAQTGSTVSKSLYRFLGTLIGAAATVALVVSLVNSPELLSLALAAWVSVCLYISLQDRTPKSYVFMLAGYSAAFIGFPGVDAPQEIFQTALLRVEEITLGVACSSLVQGLVFPVAATAAFEARLLQWSAAVREWLQLRSRRQRPGEPASASGMGFLYAHLAALQSLAHHAGYERMGAGRRTEAVARINDLVGVATPLIASLDRRLDSARNGGLLPPPPLLHALAELRLRTAEGSPERWTSLGDTLRDALQALRQEEMTLASLHWVSTTSLLLQMVQLLAKVESLQRHMGDVPMKRYRYRLPFRRHVETRLALLSSFATFTAVCLGCALWIATGWPSGSSVPMIAAVGCSFFATLDDPLPPMKMFLKYVIVSVLVTVVYSTAVLPQVHTFEMVILVLFPAFVLLGLLMATPSTAFIGMVLATNVATLLGLSNQYTSDFAATVNGAIATVSGIGLTMCVMALIRARTPEWSVRHLLRAGLDDLYATLGRNGQIRHRRLHRDAFTARMVDRLHAALPRLSRGRPADVALEADLSTELRVGVNALDLRMAMSRHRSDPSRSAVSRVLEATTDFVKARCRNLAVLPGAELLARLDTALAEVARTSPHRWDLAVPLYNLRLALFL